MNNQQKYWEVVHQKGDIVYFSKPSSFANEVLTILKPASRILEIGCGAGEDSVTFAKANHKILATDFSKNAIKKARERFSNKNLEFKVLDITQPIPFESKSFDLVYARLSLHYFSHEKTREIFKEIHRVLKPNGLLCFICKSTDDFLYGVGKKIEQDIYENEGKMRHFFSDKYTRLILSNLFNIEKLEKCEEVFYDNEKASSYVKVIARSIDINTD